MSSAIGDSGLASCLSNVFKLAEVEGLKWVRYVGPNSTTLETPKADPVLTSYATLLSEGYACSWRRLSPSTDGVSGEAKDLWIFYFATIPDLTGKLAPELQEESAGSWDDNTSLTEASAMLFRALNGLIERSLLNENFLPLGKWFARPDHSMGSNGRGCFLCNFSFFIHAHQFICASVDVRAGPALQPLMSTHLYQALSSSSGMQVILSPSGLNGIMTGHSYQLTDPGIEDLIEEWKLFYPNNFDSDSPSNLPAAVEVVLGGVRLRYPSQFVFVYHTEDSFPTPPPSPIDEGMMERVIQGGWEETTCVEPLLLQKECESCKCSEVLAHRESHSRPSRPHRLTSGSGDSLKSDRSSRHNRYRPYSGLPHPTDNATPMREQSAPSSLSLSSTVLKKHLGPPKYTTPLPSPAVAVPPSPAIKPTLFPNPSLFAAPPPATPPAQPTATRTYDLSRVTEIVSTSSERDHTPYYSKRERGWWEYMNLPDNSLALQKLVSPISPWATGFTLSSISTQPPHSPNAFGRKGVPSTVRRVRSNQDGQLPMDLTSPSKRRPSTTKGTVKLPKGPYSSEVVAPPTVLDPQVSFQDDPLEGTISVYDSTTGTSDKSSVHLIVQQDTLGGFMEGSGDTALSIKPGGNLDLTSESAVKISGDLGSLFDDSEEEDEVKTSTYETNHFTYDTDMKIQSGARGGITKVTKLIPDQLHPPPDLSRIYPTPPSVESTDEKFDDVKQLITSSMLEEKNELIENNLMMKLSPFDNVMTELVPDDFTALSNINTSNLSQGKTNVYISISSNGDVTKTKFGKSSSTPSNTMNIASEPQKFIFPPPPSLVNRHLLSLPLAGRDSTISPLISTPFPSHPSSASPMKLATARGFPRHFPSSAHTPLESPFDPITPTPMGTSRLTPILPEAHALYINLALLDSALGANVSDNVEIDFNAIQKFIIKRSNWRGHLDSVSSTGPASASLGISSNGGDNNDLLKLEEEKPLMMAEIADYPSLGFKEDIMVSTPASAPSWKQRIGLSVLPEDASTACTQTFLSIVQDYCLHLCLTGNEEFSQTSSSALASTPIALQPFQKNQHYNRHSKQTCRLYHTHSVSSAIVCGKHLLSRSLPKVPPPSAGGMKQLPSQPTLDKEDNSAAWILDLLTLPTKFVTKKLKELRLVFQNSFHHAPCIKVSTKGPMTLRDLQMLTPTQTHIGDECVPLPMQPLVVGYEHEWMSVSPLTIPTWDKLLLEPYSSCKHVLYLVVCPGGESIIDTLSSFFQNISITYKSSRLGLHAPLDKGNWEGGIITSTDSKSSEPNDQKDVKPNIKKEVPSSLPLSTFEQICKDSIGPFFSKLPTEREKLLESTTYDMSSPGRPNLPLFLVVYVVMKGVDGKMASGVSTQSQHRKVVTVMKAMSAVLSSGDIPEETRNRILIQPLDESELVGPHANNTHRLHSLAFSVFSRCCPEVKLTSDAHHLTGFGPVSSRPPPTAQTRIYSPLYILSPDPPLIPIPHAANLASSAAPQPSTILFSPDESTLFCSYCVSADKKWLLAVVCDRQAELIDTAVIGLTPNGTSDRYQPLEQLWVYLISTICTSVLKWNIVITRFGKPSSAEIREWPRIILNDGLMTANQLLKVSVQPERNIQLFPTNDTCPSISHILLLPPHPNALPAMTPTDDDIMMDDFDTSDAIIPGLAFDGAMSDDLFEGLNEMDFPSTSINPIPGEDIRAPLASGYLISTIPPGNLPSEFWGHDKPQSVCHMFKTLLHWHLSVHAYPGSPPDVLCSVLLAFDALSWLSINHVTQQRNSSLPIHLFLLSKIYNFMTVLSDSR